MSGAVGENLDSYSSKYEKLILLEDFNVESTEDAIEEFLKVYNLKNLVKVLLVLKALANLFVLT